MEPSDWTAPDLGHTFKDPSLLRTALTHRSYSRDCDLETSNNQRLEFLGDAVLALILSECLFEQFPEADEGFMTRARGMLERGSTLAALAEALDLGAYLRLGKAEEAQGGRARDSNLEDALEALVGALYLDGGYAVARDFVCRLMGERLATVGEMMETANPKGRLQEWVQAAMPEALIEYQEMERRGPPHQPIFRVNLRVGGECWAEGEGTSLKRAEEAAASVALSAKGID